MSKLYLFTGTDDDFHSAIVDLDNAPRGVSNTLLREWKPQADELGKWIASDRPRAVRLVQNIANNVFDEESIRFLSSVASLGENTHPSEINATDWVICTFELGKADIGRFTPEFAKDFHAQMLARFGK